MCDLLNRIWSRPRGEWTRVLRKELPALAGKVCEELRSGFPAFAALLAETGAEETHRAVEQAMVVALGYQENAERVRRPKDLVVTPLPMAPARREMFAALSGAKDVSDVALAEVARCAGWPVPALVQAIALASPAEAPSWPPPSETPSSAPSTVTPACSSPTPGRRPAPVWRPLSRAGRRRSAMPYRRVTPLPRCAGPAPCSPCHPAAAAPTPARPSSTTTSPHCSSSRTNRWPQHSPHAG
ncbi:hypothetical protein [Streptomyces sp. Ac-502]|uniref:hypothetical protein n=1 Tax=Streptomyces sp. Ac-502 TaxID=3342801 RepID=UPI003862A522